MPRGLGPRTSRHQILTGQRITWSHLWVCSSFTYSSGEKCTRSSHLPPTEVGSQEVSTFVSLAVIRHMHRHLYTQTHSLIYPHMHTFTSRHRCPHVSTGSFLQLCPPCCSCLCGFTNKMMQCQTITSQGRGQTAKQGGPISYHGSSYHGETEIWEHRDHGTWAKAWGTDIIPLSSS